MNVALSQGCILSGLTASKSERLIEAIKVIFKKVMKKETYFSLMPCNFEVYFFRLLLRMKIADPIS